MIYIKLTKYKIKKKKLSLHTVAEKFHEFSERIDLMGISWKQNLYF